MSVDKSEGLKRRKEEWLEEMVKDGKIEDYTE